MLRCQFLCHVLKALFFIKVALKLSYICKKMQNFRGWGLRPQTPVPPAAGGFAPRPPRQPPPHCEFLATRLMICICNDQMMAFITLPLRHGLALNNIILII